jgi:alkylhydroperoxidase family enzyme
VERIAEGEIRSGDLDGGERAIAALVHKSVIAPARLEPKDLGEVVSAYGVNGSIEIVAVLGAFHFVNRVADLVGIRSDLPLIRPRWRRLRRLGVRLQAWGMRALMDLSNQAVEVNTEAALAEAEAALGPLPAGYQAVREVPNVAGFLTTVARVVRELDPEMLERVGRVVASALPAREEEAVGFHPRPADPLEALSFVGTRYAVRTTDRMVDAVREKYGYSDAELTDLFYAISMQNAVERMHRLLAAPPSTL